jgi:glycine dehydrogenase
VIQRNVLENPGWYTQYTPYQARSRRDGSRRCSTSRRSSATSRRCRSPTPSLLDEATAAAEALTLCHRHLGGKRNLFFVARDLPPQTIAVVQTRAEALGIEVLVGEPQRFDFAKHAVAGALVQYPATDGRLLDLAPLVKAAHDAGALVVVATDLLALTLLRAPATSAPTSRSASAQRFGVPMGFGGPHAAFLSAREEFKRHVPGRIIGLSKDAAGGPALRMALQTREQHIRREKATSNICTAQALLAITASFYAVHHGPKDCARSPNACTRSPRSLHKGLGQLGFTVPREPVFDTFFVGLGKVAAEDVLAAARAERMNLRAVDAHTVGIALDETTNRGHVDRLLGAFARVAKKPAPSSTPWPAAWRRRSPRRTRARARTSRTPCSTATAPSTSSCATSSGSRRATCRSRRR